MALRKVSRCRPAVSNETILATRQEFFFTKVASVQSITDIALLDFWLMLLSWMFFSSYTSIYFLVKTFIFPNVYISVNAIFECLYMFLGWERGHLLGMYTTAGGWGVIQNVYSSVQRDGVSRLMCTCASALSLSMFWQHLCYIVSCFICRN